MADIPSSKKDTQPSSLRRMGAVLLGISLVSPAAVGVSSELLPSSTASALTAQAATSGLSTALQNSDGSGQVQDGSAVPLATSIYDTVSVSSGSAAPTGTLTYSFFSNAGCAGPASSTTQVSLEKGAVPNSSSVGPLPAGSYAFQATYSGDTNYQGSTGPCDSFTVDQGTTSSSSSVSNATSGAGVSQGSTLPRGTSVIDSANVNPSSNVFVPTSTVTYDFFNNATCSGTPISPEPVALDSSGNVGSSAATASLAPGSYAFQTAYAGDRNYKGSTSSCAPFSVSKKATTSKAPPPLSAFYVAPPPLGNDYGGSNNCLTKQAPCATIAQAINQEAGFSPGTTGTAIILARGSYDDPSDIMFAALTAANDNVTITGAGKGTIIYPQNCAALEVTSSTIDKGYSAIVNFQNLTGVTVQDMTLNGGAVAGGECPGYEAAVFSPRSAGGTTNSVVDTTIEGGAPFGILNNDNASMNIISNTLTSSLCTATVTGPNTGLNADWSSPANLNVSAIPNCARLVPGSHWGFTAVYIDGVAYCATTSTLPRTLIIMGTMPCTSPRPVTSGPEIPRGVTLIYNTSVPAFTQYGIACNNPSQVADHTTICAISDNTVTASGWTYSNQPIGIVVTGAGIADVDGNTVSGITDTAEDGIGIGLIPDFVDGAPAGNTVVGADDSVSPSSGSGNKVSASDTGITVIGSSAVPVIDPGYQINGNTVSNANVAGILVAGLGVGFGHLATGMESNSASGVLLGEGLLVEGLVGQTIGGATASGGNSFTGDGIGLLLAPCSTATCEAENGGSPIATTGNLVQENTLTGNVAYGVFDPGNYQEHESWPALGSLSSTGNTFNANNWGTIATKDNGGSQPTTIHGANILDGTGWGGGCSSCSLNLVYMGSSASEAAGTATITLSVVTSTGALETVPAGTEITIPGWTATFFVTASAALGNVPMNVSAQAPGPGHVPSFSLNTGAAVNVNQNGAAVSTGNTYGTGSAANSCTPDGVNGTPNQFGVADSSSSPSSLTLDAGTGAVNATYIAC